MITAIIIIIAMKAEEKDRDSKSGLVTEFYKRWTNFLLA
jgi:hypothetical protein